MPRDFDTKPAKTLPPAKLVFCDKCGCHYLDGCPNEDHPGYRKPEPPPAPPARDPVYEPEYCYMCDTMTPCWHSRGRNYP